MWLALGSPAGLVGLQQGGTLSSVVPAYLSTLASIAAVESWQLSPEVFHVSKKSWWCCKCCMHLPHGVFALNDSCLVMYMNFAIDCLTCQVRYMYLLSCPRWRMSLIWNLTPVTWGFSCFWRRVDGVVTAVCTCQLMYVLLQTVDWWCIGTYSRMSITRQVTMARLSHVLSHDVEVCAACGLGSRKSHFRWAPACVLWLVNMKQHMDR